MSRAPRPSPAATARSIRASSASNTNGWTTGQNNFQWWYRDNPVYNRTLLTPIDLVEASPGRWVYERNPFWPVDLDPPGADPALRSLVATGAERTRDGGHNFYFTSEVRHWCQFTPDTNPANNPVLTFYGDDDVWVFIKNRLTVDVGGIHGRAQESVTLLDNGDARVHPCSDRTICAALGDYDVDLNLEAGRVYEIVVFQAERHVTGSNYQLTLEGFGAGTSVCAPECGVDPPVVTPGEECDDGIDNGQGYGRCNNCQLEGYCGDRLVNGPESCDNGVNNSVYGNTAGACAPGCVAPPRCGDGAVNAPFEECDLGAGNTASGYDGCTTGCEIGPYCGDGILSAGEACDDGVNDGFYGSCFPDCTPAARCGDGSLDAEWGEQCDPPDAATGCSDNCRLGAQCGDAVVQPGEQCDDGVNDGGYGECGPSCQYGPRCGDGVVQAPGEQCDDGEGNNTGGYGRCAPGCVYGPYCGDGRVQAPHEQCDDGGNASGDGCSSACRDEVSIPR